MLSDPQRQRQRESESESELSTLTTIGDRDWHSPLRVNEIKLNNYEKKEGKKQREQSRDDAFRWRWSPVVS